MYINIFLYSFIHVHIKYYNIEIIKKIDVHFIIVLFNLIECVLMLPQTENWLNHDDIRFVIFHNIFAPHTLAYSKSCSSLFLPMALSLR